MGSPRSVGRDLSLQRFWPLHALLCEAVSQGPKGGLDLGSIESTVSEDTLLIFCHSPRKPSWARLPSQADSQHEHLDCSRAQLKGVTWATRQLFLLTNFWGYILENMGSDLSLLVPNWLTSLTDFKPLSKLTSIYAADAGLVRTSGGVSLLESGQRPAAAKTQMTHSALH